MERVRRRIAASGKELGAAGAAPFVVRRRTPSAAVAVGVGVRRRYWKALQRYRKTRHPDDLFSANVLRKRMLKGNSSHPADARKADFDVRGYERGMPEDFRQLYQRTKRSAEGRQALRRYKKFWGVMPSEIRMVELPGSGKTKVLVGMGRAGKGGKIRTPDGRTTRAKGAKLVACDAKGRQILLLSGKNSNARKAKLKEVGRVEETHYVPTSNQERAKTFKRNAYWVHRHDDEGGKFPKVARDQAGNYIYDRGTYTVTDWIRR